MNGEQIFPLSWGGHHRVRAGKVEKAPKPEAEPFSFNSLPPSVMNMEEASSSAIPEELLHALPPGFSLPPVASWLAPKPKKSLQLALGKKEKRKPCEIAPSVRGATLHKSSKRRRRDQTYEEEDNSIKDISFESDGDEYVPEEQDEEEEDTDEDDEGSEEESMQLRKKQKGKKAGTWPERMAANNDSDADDADIGELLRHSKNLHEAERKKRKTMRREQMRDAVLEGFEGDESSQYTPDQRDGEVWARLRGHINVKTKKFQFGQAKISEQTIEKLAAGRTDLEGPEKIAEAATGDKYLEGMRRLLGYLQESFNEYEPETLRSGKIQLWHFFDFVGQDHLGIRDLGDLIDKKEKVLSYKPHCLGGYRALATLVLSDLTDISNRAKFHDPSVLDRRERIDNAEETVDKMQANINLKLDLMQKSHWFQKWEEQKRGAQAKKKQFERVYMGMAIPNTTDVIKTFWLSKEVKSFIERIVKIAESIVLKEDVVLDGSLVPEMNEMIPVILAMRSGNRPELLMELTLGMFWTAIGDVYNPNKPIHCDPRVDQKKIKDRVKDGMYTNPNPKENDPLDPEPDHESPLSSMLKGWIIPADLHKTFYKYQLNLFLSQMDHFLVRIYNLLVDHYLAQEKLPKRTSDSHVFVNKNGNRLGTTKSCFFSLRRFRMITGHLSMSAYTFRHMFTNTLHNTQLAILIQCEAYAAGHSEETARRTYISETLGTMMAKKGTTAYREIVGIREDLVAGPDVVAFLGEGEEGRGNEIRTEVHNRNVDQEMYRLKMLTKTKVVVSEKRAINDNQKIALIQLIEEHDSIHHPSHRKLLSSAEDLPKLFLSGLKGSNRRNDMGLAKLLLRMLDCCDEDSEARIELQEHLVLWCRLKAIKFSNLDDIELKLRVLELQWAEALLQTLDKMKGNRGSKPVGNDLVAELLIRMALRRNSTDFNFGCAAIKEEIVSILATREGLYNPEADKEKPEKLLPKKYHQAFKEKSKKPNEEPLKDMDMELSSEEEETDLTRHDTAQDLRIGDINITNIQPDTPIQITPVKKGKRINWTDQMKRQVLLMYIRQAADPLKRPDWENTGLKSKTVWKEMIPEKGDIYQKGCILLDGVQTPLKSFCLPDSLHQHFGWLGFTGQKKAGWSGGTGLCHVIDFAMKDQEQTKEKVREMEEEILEIAMRLSSDNV